MVEKAHHSQNGSVPHSFRASKTTVVSPTRQLKFLDDVGETSVGAGVDMVLDLENINILSTPTALTPVKRGSTTRASSPMMVMKFQTDSPIKLRDSANLLSP